MRTAVVALGDIEILGQGPHDVETASTLAQEVRRQLGSERKAGTAVENVQDRRHLAPVEKNFNRARGVPHDVPEQFAEDQLSRTEPIEAQSSVT